MLYRKEMTINIYQQSTMWFFLARSNNGCLSLSFQGPAMWLLYIVVTIKKCAVCSGNILTMDDNSIQWTQVDRTTRAACLGVASGYSWIDVRNFWNMFEINKHVPYHNFPCPASSQFLGLSSYSFSWISSPCSCFNLESQHHATTCLPLTGPL